MTIRFVIRGRVQGVGYRAYVQGVARELGVVGEVHNCEGGTVEGVAAHSDGQLLSEFGRRLSLGPGRPEGADWDGQPAAPLGDTFVVGPTLR